MGFDGLPLTEEWTIAYRERSRYILNMFRQAREFIRWDD